MQKAYFVLRCAWGVLVILFGVAHAQVSDFPYYEDFESSAGGYNAGGESGWEWGVPAGPFISSAANGERAWVTGLMGSPIQGWSYVESPEFDFTLFDEDPTLQFEHIFDLSPFAVSFVEISINGGPYAKLGQAGDAGSVNWYVPGLGSGFWTYSSGEANAWRTARHKLDSAAGNLVRLRWRRDGNTSTPFSGVGIDGVWVYDTLTDVGVSSVCGSAEGLAYTAQEEVRCILRNSGSEPVQGFAVSFEVTGQSRAAATEIFSGVIEPLEEVPYTFAATVDLTSPGDYTISVTTAHAGDEFAGNDTAQLVVTQPNVVTSFPYLEDFEAGPGSYSAAGDELAWEWGVPSGLEISSAASGSSAWVTKLDGDYDLEGTQGQALVYLASPIFDLTEMAKDPFVQFSHIFELGNWDRTSVEVSLDGGPFEVLGVDLTAAAPPSLNWSGTSWSGSTGGVWRTARHPILGAAGRSVQLRWTLDDNLSNSEVEGVGVDDVELYEGEFGDGQPAVPGVALLSGDSFSTFDPLGFKPLHGVPGPFYTSGEPDSQLNLHVEGPPHHPILLFSGTLAVDSLQLPGGQVDLDDLVLLASGLETGGLNPFFVTNANGEFNLSISLPPSLASTELNLQAAIVDAALGFVITNVVVVIIGD